MTRRMNHYDNPDWQPYLIVALVGAVVIGCGILAILWQLFVSVRDRNKNRDLTGDPWDGRSLEWATASPAPFYNSRTSRTSRHSSSIGMTRKRAVPTWRPAAYEDIHMPRNTSAGFIVSVFGLVLVLWAWSGTSGGWRALAWPR